MELARSWELRCEAEQNDEDRATDRLTDRRTEWHGACNQCPRHIASQLSSIRRLRCRFIHTASCRGGKKKGKMRGNRTECSEWSTHLLHSHLSHVFFCYYYRFSTKIWINI